MNHALDHLTRAKNRMIAPTLRRLQHIQVRIFEIVAAFETMIYTLSRDPESARFAPTWIVSFLPRHSHLDNEIPWMSYRAVEWLESWLKPSMTVFEYGSGASTIFFAKRVMKIISVEHDRTWHDRISTALLNQGILNVELILCEPEKESSLKMLSSNRQNYTSRLEEYHGMRFEKYARSIEEYSDKSFDLVIIDGRARRDCIPLAVPKIRRGGHLLLDDSERPQYENGILTVAKYERIDFLGLRAKDPNLHLTSVWKIE